MSRTNHHRNQKSNHEGYDYGGKYKHNRHQGGGYGTEGRDAADKERREESKSLVEEGIDALDPFQFNSPQKYCRILSGECCGVIFELRGKREDWWCVYAPRQEELLGQYWHWSEIGADFVEYYEEKDYWRDVV